ncbi:hypothetical protein PDJAM_G00258540 [Pangasius djambal]|uniref:Uncharacterized protein n=1 Tax=Pangasius djambal TaxID=1691987 RepID=A0ACC5YKV8_9TELE|nr:hypothetical protein [Pangasius djambal]
MDMAVVNTYFQKREEHRVTYKSGGRSTQVDYILCRRGSLKEISDCKVVVGESVARQHRMVVCRMTLMVCKKKRSKIEIEKKTKWWELKKEECCEDFRQKLRQALCGQVVLPDDWETTAEVIRVTGRKVLGVSSGRRKEDKETWWWNAEVQDSIQRKRNLEGQMVVDFAKRMDMAVVNTYFQKREEHRVTYKSGGRSTQVDYILCRRGSLKEISDCKVVVGEGVARQHRMVACRMTLMVCKKKRSKMEIEKKTKWWRLKKEECCEDFRQKLRQALGGQAVLPDDWETTAEVIRVTGRKVLGVSSGRRKEDKEAWWWNEEVQDSIQRKRLARKKWDVDRTEENRQEYKELQCRVKREVSKAKQEAYDELYTRMTLMVCKKKRSKIEIEKKTKWWKLKKEECCEDFRQKLRQALGGQVVLPDDWETTAEVIRVIRRKVLGVSSERRKEDKETWWWNEEVQDSIQRKRLAKKKWDMDRTEDNRQEYKELQRRVKREVSKAKQEAYDELYTRLDTREGQKDLYRLARQRDRDGKDVQQVAGLSAPDTIMVVVKWLAQEAVAVAVGEGLLVAAADVVKLDHCSEVAVWSGSDNHPGLDL